MSSPNEGNVEARRLLEAPTRSHSPQVQVPRYSAIRPDTSSSSQSAESGYLSSFSSFSSMTSIFKPFGKQNNASRTPTRKRGVAQFLELETSLSSASSGNVKDLPNANQVGGYDGATSKLNMASQLFSQGMDALTAHRSDSFTTIGALKSEVEDFFTTIGALKSEVEALRKDSNITSGSIAELSQNLLGILHARRGPSSSLFRLTDEYLQILSIVVANEREGLVETLSTVHHDVLPKGATAEQQRLQFSHCEQSLRIDIIQRYTLEESDYIQANMHYLEEARIRSERDILRAKVNILEVALEQDKNEIAQHSAECERLQMDQCEAEYRLHVVKQDAIDETRYIKGLLATNGALSRELEESRAKATEYKSSFNAVKKSLDGIQKSLQRERDVQDLYQLIDNSRVEARLAGLPILPTEQDLGIPRRKTYLTGADVASRLGESVQALIEESLMNAQDPLFEIWVDGHMVAPGFQKILAAATITEELQEDLSEGILETRKIVHPQVQCETPWTLVAIDLAEMERQVEQDQHNDDQILPTTERSDGLKSGSIPPLAHSSNHSGVKRKREVEMDTPEPDLKKARAAFE